VSPGKTTLFLRGNNKEKLCPAFEKQRPSKNKFSQAPEKQKTRNFRCGFFFAEKEGFEPPEV
jgi:hypothetical protein